MKNRNSSRLIFNTGVHFLIVMVTTIVATVFFKDIFQKIEFIGPQGGAATLLLGASLATVLVFYELISKKIFQFIEKSEAEKDRDEAISVLEKHGVKVGTLLIDLPKDPEGNEHVDCIRAYMRLKAQGATFVLINQSSNQIPGSVYICGAAGKNDHNKYKLLIGRASKLKSGD